MKPPTAYSILKELGNDALHKYIYENIAEPTFDSHRITNLFPQDFRDYYERMLIAQRMKATSGIGMSSSQTV